MSDADKLRTMITGYSTLVPNLSASWDSITAEITDLYEQWSALVAAQDGIEGDLSTYVTGAGAKADYFYQYGNFGVSGTGILNEWMGFDQESVTGLLYVDSQHIRVDGDQTSTFTAGTSAILAYPVGNFTVSTTVSGSTYNTPYAGDTYIAFNDAVVPASVNGVYLPSYAPWGAMWDSDTTVQGYMDDWVFIDDHITKTLSSTGTYGVQDTIAKLAIAKALVLINMNKYDAAGPILEPYAT